MDNTTTHPDLEPLRSALAAIGLADLLETYVARERVGVRYCEIARVAADFGLEFKHEHGNVDNIPAPALRIVTRSDVAAVYGSKRRAA